MNAVVTGPTGAVGRALISELLSSGESVTALVNPESRRLGALTESELLRIEKCDIGAYRGFCGDSETEYGVFYHLAWRGSSGSGRNDARLQEDNLESSFEAVRLASRLGCKTFVFAGSQAEYGVMPYGVKLRGDTPCNPVTEYGKYKLRAGYETRKLCESLGIKHIYVRILSVYGPYDGSGSMISNAVRLLERGEAPKYTAGEQIWDYLYSHDAAKALHALAVRGSGEKIYALGSGEGMPLYEYVKIIHKVVNPDIPVVLGELEYGKNQVMYLVADITELTNDTGFVPEVSFEEGIRSCLEWKI